jgi:hypothetical protein
MNQIKTLRKVALLVLVFASILTLAACKSTDSIPYGNISDDVYMSVGNITVTEKELYDQLRMQGASVLSTMVDEIIFAEQITTVRGLLQSGDEELNKFLDDTINNAIHGTTNKESLEKLYNDNLDRFNRNIEQFADSLYLLDNTISISGVIAAIQGLDVAYEGYSVIPFLVERYVLRGAQRQYAKDLLVDEVDNEDHANFISEQNLVTYYKTNMQNRYDVDALVIRFINLNEANAALYQASIKSDSRGRWYQIPDIRIADQNDPRFVDLNDTSETGFGHVRTILQDLNILGKLGVDLLDRSQISIADYQNYYTRYVISTSRTTGRNDEPMTTAQVKEAFVGIYNLLNPAAQVEVALDGSIVGKAGSTFNATLTYDDLTKMNTSLRTHVYTTLTAEASMEDPEDVTTVRPYSSRIQTFGNSRYLVFKLSDEKASEEGILIADPEDDKKEIFSDIQAALDIKAEVRAKLFEQLLSNTYISSKVNALYGDIKVDIYDPVIRIFYEQAYGYEGTTKNRGGNVLATVNGTEILVDAFYEKLEKSYGINLSLDIVSNKFLLASEDYSVTSTQMDTFKKQFEEIISQFSANNFASAGFPASMGREKFLILAFGARTNTEAVNQLYVFPELRQQFLNDYENHFGDDDNEIYDLFAALAEKQFNNFKSITVSHLLIFFDENGDGTPDNPQEYLDKLGPVGAQQVKDGLVQLVELLYTKVGDYKGFSEGLQGLATEFNNSGRILRGSATPPYDYQLELVWSQFRQLGFHFRFENLPNPITNTSNFITGSSVLDQVFYNRAMEIHARLALEENDDSKFPHLDMYGTAITEADMDSVQSSFGWHLILATSVRNTVSAVFSEESDEAGRYVSEDGTLNAYNEDSETLTASQIKFYLTEQKKPEGVVLPTEVQTAVSNYLNPILTRYNNTNMQRELIFKLLENATFANANGAARFNTIREINRRQINEYMLSTTGGVFDANYDALYGDWFNILENGVN